MAVLPIYQVKYIVLSISANRTTEELNNASLIIQADRHLQGGVGRSADPHQRDNLRIHWRRHAASSSLYSHSVTEVETPLQCHPLRDRGLIPPRHERAPVVVAAVFSLADNADMGNDFQVS